LSRAKELAQIARVGRWAFTIRLIDRSMLIAKGQDYFMAQFTVNLQEF
jgi:hypothetical protein